MSPQPDPPPNPPTDPARDPGDSGDRADGPGPTAGGSGWGPPPPGWSQWPPPPGGTGNPGIPLAPAAKPGVLELRPLGFADLLDATFAVVRRAPLPTVANAILVQLVPALLSLLLIQRLDVTVLGVERLLADAAAGPGSAAWEPGAWARIFEEPWQFYAGAGAALLAVQLLANVLVVGPTTVAAMRAVLGLGTGWGRGLVLSGPAMLRIAGWNLLLGLGSVLLVGLLGAGTIVLAGAVGFPAAVLAMLAVVLMLMVVGVWVGIRLSMVPTLLVTRAGGILRAARSSWVLARGSWWRIAGILLVVAVVLGILEGVLSQLVSVVGAELLGANGTFTTWIVLGVVLNALVGALGMVLGQLMLVMLHVDLRIRTERLDLALATEALAPSPPDIPGRLAPMR
ncbi:MAG: hypothetical protein Q4P23_06680 [Micrococcaceae bacterium]|nr:hypothetical protein [Micrococcaceae bacterium]